MNFSLDLSLPLLERTPRVVRSLLAGLAPDWTLSNYGPDTWSPHEVVGHLIHGEKTDWMPRARLILEKGESQPFEPFDRSGHARLCREKTLAELLDLFETLRAENLKALRAMSLTSDDLARKGLHPALGTVTLGELIATWVAHDLNHIAQVCKAMACQHKMAVGPWVQYLSILAPPAPR